MNNNEVLNASGHLEIIKIYPDGKQEKVFDDQNVITSGMGVGLAMLFAGQGSSTVEDFQIRFFQVGSGAPTTYDYKQAALGGPVGATTAGVAETASYGGDVYISRHKRMLSNGGASTDSESFALIPDYVIKKSSPTSVTFNLYLPVTSSWPQDLDEIGLFMSNPLAALIATKARRSVLVAYRTFTAIRKTDEFSLLFKWKLSF
tara:strand:- start:3724 stop:4332 length:609 start_codon:yes stop_codon:yes gene_type:complete